MITIEPPVNRDPDKLHPAFRVLHDMLIKRLASEELPFLLFEGFRTNERQAWLFDSGRNRPGPILTKARAGYSYHQYGLCGDYALWIPVNGKVGWSWDVSKENGAKWQRLHEIGIEIGLEPLSFELPHLQLAGLKIEDLRAGRLPPDPALMGSAGFPERMKDLAQAS